MMRARTNVEPVPRWTYASCHDSSRSSMSRLRARSMSFLVTAVAGAVEMHCSQVGMLAAIGGRFVVLDHVSEVEAFAALHGPLVQGYALDALEALAAPPPSIDDARDFV